MDPGKIFQIITNSTLLATRLISGVGGPLQFSEPRYCLLVAEDAPPALKVAQVKATHREGAAVRYSITGGNRDGLFTIDQRTGIITLAAHLDYELQPRHDLVVRAEAGVGAVLVVVQVTVVDVNDHAPSFPTETLTAEIVEEDASHLPATILKVEAVDEDAVDRGGLVYSLGEGHTPSHALPFSINPHTGHLLQLRAVNRDPPDGRAVWQVRVQVRDGQRVSPSLIAAADRASRHRPRSALHLHPLQAPPHTPLKQEEEEERGHPFPGVYFKWSGDKTSKIIPLQESPRSSVFPGGREVVPDAQGEDTEKEEEKRQEAGARKSPRMQEGGESGGRIPFPMGSGDGAKRQRTSRPEAGTTRLQRKRKRGGEFMPKNRRTPKRKTREKTYRSTKEDMMQGRLEAAGARPEIRRDKQEKRRDSVRVSKIFPSRMKSEGVESLGMGRRRMREAPFSPGGRSRLHHLPLRRRTRQINIVKRKWSSHRDKHNANHLGDEGNIEDNMYINFKRPHLPHTNWTMDRRSVRCGGREFLGRCHHQPCLVSSRLSARGAKLPRNRYRNSLLLRPPAAPGRPSGEGGGDVKRIDKRRRKRERTSNNADPGHIPLLPPNVIGEEKENKNTDKQEARKEHNHSYSDTRTTITTHHNHQSTKDNSSTSTNNDGTSSTHHSRPKRDTHRNANSLDKNLVYIRRYKAMNGRCDTYDAFSMHEENETEKKEDEVLAEEKEVEERDEEAMRTELEWRRRTESMIAEMRRGEVHVAETVVSVGVKDVNDNAPVFPNTTMYGEVQENGPINQVFTTSGVSSSSTYLSAGVVWAWDADDQENSNHASLTYSIEKNVMDERTGEAIFLIHPQTGLIHTAICCLDRETTPQYEVQVVAQDGGGLKGTGTVVVRLADVNDNSPRLSRDLWAVEVDETIGHAPPANLTLLQITATDRDTSNYFYYRVVEASGWGWQHFGVRTIGAAGHLYALKTLDYEDAAQRRGFRFMVQVTDRGRGGWGDSRHTDTAWVEVRLRDVNDNPPVFARPHAHVTVREDAAPGTLITSLTATDPDEGGRQGISYKVQGGWGALRVDAGGGVRLWRALDREAAGGAVGVARIIAVDTGTSPLSSTATLTITVTDVNDCPPRLLPPTRLQAREGAPPSLLGVLKATDDDLWQLGHGPPFTFALAASNPGYVMQAVTLKPKKELDSGRGGAEVWTVVELDREERAEVTVEVVVGDAGGRVASYPVTVVVADVNDNPMRPGAKVVRVWKVQGGGADVALGRVYVEDPDDWDLEDKSFRWAGPPHPLFSLHHDTGEMFGSSQLRERRYELHFLVDDRRWGQRDIPANVTVEVTHLSPESLASAVPLTLSPTSPAALTAAWTPQTGGGGLGTLSEAVKEVVGGAGLEVLIVSVYGSPHTTPHPLHAPHTPLEGPPIPRTWVWVCVKETGPGAFMDPVKLRGLLSLHQEKLERVMNLRVLVGDAAPPSPSTPQLHPPSLASMVLPLQVVDTNVTSLVTPRLSHALPCPPPGPHHEGDACTPTSCLNGGRCVMGKRCLCPVGASGTHCKVLSRSFFGRGWVWIRPPAPCLPTTLSLRLLPLQPDALLLYSGPLSATPSPQRYPPTPLLVVQVVRGRPQVLVEGGRGPLKVEVNVTLTTRTWHSLHLHVDAQGVVLAVEKCGGGGGTAPPTHPCLARAGWGQREEGVEGEERERVGGWTTGGPLQVGGLAHAAPRPQDFGWSGPTLAPALHGCLSHLKLNGELVDLGEPAHSSGSKGGCHVQEAACGRGNPCGRRGRCVGGLDAPWCECEPGWAGAACSSPTTPISLSSSSFAQLVLPHPPHPYNVEVGVRVRGRGRPEGLLLHLADDTHTHAFRIKLRGGVACAGVDGARQRGQEVCLEGVPLGDGAWHSLSARRQGHNIEISVDDSVDGWHHNSTLPSFFASSVSGDLHALLSPPPPPINASGVLLGGVPELVGPGEVVVREDLTEVCIDDVRVGGKALPLPPALNHTSWGHVASFRGLQPGCPAPDPCPATTCLPPLTCRPSWTHEACSCGPGRQLLGRKCVDIDECVYRPCLHGGSCYNLRPGYRCACGPAHGGDNCEWVKMEAGSHPLNAPLAIAALTLSVLVVVLIGVVLTVRHQRARAARGEALGHLTKAGAEVLECRLSPQPSTTTRLVHTTPPGTTPYLHHHPHHHVLASLSHPGGGGGRGIGGVTTGVGVGAAGGVGGGQPHPHHPEEEAIEESGGEGVAIMKVSLPPLTPPPSLTPPSGIPSKISLHANTRRPLAMQQPRQEGEAVPSVSCRCKEACPAGGAAVVGPSTSSPGAAPCGLPPSAAERLQQVIACRGAPQTQPLLAQDDLRAYAYEGDGSPSSCLSSAVLGLPTEAQEEEEEIPKSLVPEYREVLDLLKNLPDAVSSLEAPKEEPDDPSSSSRGAGILQGEREGGSGPMPLLKDTTGEGAEGETVSPRPSE